MFVYRVSYFDNVAWVEKDVTVIAQNEEEISQALNYSHYTNINIEQSEIVSTPYVLNTWDNDF